ncbi:MULTISPECIES: hypothetical protein [Streptomyces]|uniref:hypothetical protein n=1 Tax=Streptomyces TaxID=1883 RepID=UPI001601077D|nr:hypothetical protein [Streptomyces murinus]MBA9046344.1 hypothetical protein [Streptomyces murinus]
MRLSVSAVIPALLLTACSAKGDPAPAATHHRGGAQADRKLTAQAQSALDAASDGGSSMVESGVERVSDGVHTQPGPTHGAAGKKAVPCDGSVVFERLTAESALKVDVRGKPGAAGMIAWRINKT